MILVEKLTREFDGVGVLSGLSFSVSAGERLALRGPNGSGKTTLLRCLLGTVAPTSGRVGSRSAVTTPGRWSPGGSSERL